MKKLVYLFFLTFFPLFLILFADNTQAATCNISLNQTSFASDYRGEVIVTSNSPCFQTNIRYTIIAYPASAGFNPSISNYAVARQNPTSQSEIRFNMDLATSAIGRNSPGTWNVIVCSETATTNCNQSENIVGTSSLQVTAPADPPPPSNLPQIVREEQAQCRFQKGSPVNIQVKNTQPSAQYHWWWNEGWIPPSLGNTRASSTEMTINITGDQTDKTGSRRLCVDISQQKRATNTNCITLFFEGGPPTGDISCKSPIGSNANCALEPGGCTTSGGRFCTPDDPNSGIVTAIGCVPTNPDEFIKAAFNLSVGIGGGIAFLLMVFGAFEMVTSNGNPDALKNGQDRFKAAIIGILFIIFSVILLRIIGVDVLGLDSLI